MKVYILLQKPGDDLSSLPQDAEIEYVLKHVPSHPFDSIVETTHRRLERVLDEAPDGSYIVFNGPSWLCALAGYVWMSSENRNRTRMFVFNNITKKYNHVDYAYAG